ncbi:MAG: outer membrane lipid asymmetry maintenance protein MlaD [Syntrophobacterales bacterium]|jgi:phospholipid/cholesterol/gamma-HCH transport system substrate-binding protein|nr:outer membrane lipid asymmetry maintenance protein MlaD [Syntrophobacterales bacterium]
MKKYSMETIVGIFIVFGIICVGYMAMKLGKVNLFGEDTYPLYARFTSVSGLRVGSSVDVYGIEVGHITGLTIDAERQMALVKMNVKKGMEIYDDASATVKSQGLIGDRYVKIDPGGAGEILKTGGLITQTSVPADIEDLIGKVAFGEVKNEPAPKKPTQQDNQ